MQQRNQKPPSPYAGEQDENDAPRERQQRDGRHFVFYEEVMGPRVLQPPTPKRRQS